MMYGNKPIEDWTEKDFRNVFEYMAENYDPNVAWQLLYRLIQLRAGEIDDVQFAYFEEYFPSPYSLLDDADNDDDSDDDDSDDDSEGDEGGSDDDDDDDDFHGTYGIHHGRFF